MRVGVAGVAAVSVIPFVFAGFAEVAVDPAVVLFIPDVFPVLAVEAEVVVGEGGAADGGVDVDIRGGDDAAKVVSLVEVMDVDLVAGDQRRALGRGRAGVVLAHVVGVGVLPDVRATEKVGLVFDGRVFVPETPVSLPERSRIEIELPDAPPPNL